MPHLKNKIKRNYKIFSLVFNPIDTNDILDNPKTFNEKNEIKNKIPNITNLATNTAPTAVENEIPNARHLVKKS